MKSTAHWVVTLLAAATVGCSSDPSNPDDETGNSIPGLDIDAAVTQIAGGGSVAPGMILAVEVNLRNTTATAIQKSIPAGCAVRARLYLSGNDDLLYDQTLFPCNVSTSTTLTIPPGESVKLTSGTHFPHTIQADSVPPGFYRVTAVLRVVGENPIEIEAGTYRLPNCPTPSTCVFVGPGAVVGPSKE